MNFTYTTTPIPDPTQDHVGFFVVLGACIFILIAVFLHDCDYKRRWAFREFVPTIIAAIALSFVMSYAYKISYLWSKVPANEQVIATKVNDIETHVSTGGKHPRLVPAMFVIYRVPEGEVQFRKGDGIVYPDTVVLYKN